MALADPNALPEYDPNTLPKDATVLIVGPRLIGKSTLSRDLLQHARCEHSLIFSSDPAYQDAAKYPNVHKAYDKDVLDRFVESQKLSNVANPSPFGRERTAVVIDDLIKFRGDNGLDAIFQNGRHLHVVALIEAQVPTALTLPPTIRSNIDCVFITPYSEEQRRACYKHYFEPFGIPYTDFCATVDSLKPFEWLVFDSRALHRYHDATKAFFRYTVRVEGGSPS